MRVVPCDGLTMNAEIVACSEGARNLLVFWSPLFSLSRFNEIGLVALSREICASTESSVGCLWRFWRRGLSCRREVGIFTEWNWWVEIMPSFLRFCVGKMRVIGQGMGKVFVQCSRLFGFESKEHPWKSITMNPR